MEPISSTKFIAVRRYNVRREDTLNVAIDEQAQLLGKFWERERQRIVSRVIMTGQKTN